MSNQNVQPSSDKNDLGITAKKVDDFSEWYSQVIRKAELIEYSPVSGCIVLRPYSYSIWEELQSFIDQRIKKLGVKNAYFPLFIPESLLKREQDHVEGFTPEVAWVTHAGESQLSERLAVRPTSETIMYDSYAKWIRSHKDLPLKLNQWCSVVRWEFKHPMPFLRTREFLWQEGHTVFASKREAEKEVKDILNLYTAAYEELYAVPVLKGRKTEAEKFAGADYTLSIEAFMPNNRAIQAATSHFLGQNFSKAFGISFLDETGKKEFGFQNSWGFTTRSIGVMLSIHGDDKGIVLPPRVAPVQVVIVPIVFSKNPEGSKKVMDAVKKIKKDLSKLRVEVDDRDGYSPGFKFNYWEMKGVPLRIEIGPKDLESEQAIVFRRDISSKQSLSLSDLKKKIPKLLDEVQEDLLNKARNFLNNSIIRSNDFESLKSAIESGKIAFAPWCEDSSCEAKVKQETGAKSLNIPFDQPKEKSKCSICGKDAKVWVYFAKSY